MVICLHKFEVRFLRRWGSTQIPLRHSFLYSLTSGMYSSLFPLPFFPSSLGLYHACYHCCNKSQVGTNAALKSLGHSALSWRSLNGRLNSPRARGVQAAESFQTPPAMERVRHGATLCLPELRGQWSE